VKVILIIIGATGSLSLSFQIHLDEITGKYFSMKLQKMAIQGKTHILQNILT
jgi:hypothetical protein